MNVCNLCSLCFALPGAPHGGACPAPRRDPPRPPPAPEARYAGVLDAWLRGGPLLPVAGGYRPPEARELP